MNARRAAVGDRLHVTLTRCPADGDPVDTIGVVVVDRVTRLSCGCDRAEGERPDSMPGMRVHLLPASCGHEDGVDYDAARAKAST